MMSWDEEGVYVAIFDLWGSRDGIVLFNQRSYYSSGSLGLVLRME